MRGATARSEVFAKRCRRGDETDDVRMIHLLIYRLGLAQISPWLNFFLLHF